MDRDKGRDRDMDTDTDMKISRLVCGFLSFINFAMQVGSGEINLQREIKQTEFLKFTI